MSRLTSWRTDVEQDGRMIHMTERIILDKPSEIVLERFVGGSRTALPAQTVRIETSRIVADRDVDLSGRESSVNVVIIGFKNHPTYGTLDIRPGDKFVLNGLRFDVKGVLPELPYSVQAWAEALG
ncbi:MAG: hypothetical protein QXS68_03130 [Candidatus Methanomethylicaceae archaeon]